MIREFLRARVQNLIANSSGARRFKLRSQERDSDTDLFRIQSIIVAIEAALKSAESERDGLMKRLIEVGLKGRCGGFSTTCT